MKIPGEMRNSLICIKSLEPNDFSRQIVKWFNDPVINQYLMARFKKNYIFEQVKYINELNKSNSAYYFGIFLTSNSSLIGTCTCRLKNQNELEIGLMIGENNFWRKGIGTATLSLIEDFAKKIGVSKLSAGIEVDNTASVSLFTKRGYLLVKKGKLNDFGVECLVASKHLENRNLKSNKNIHKRDSNG